MNKLTKYNRNTPIHIENKPMVAKGEGVGEKERGTDQEDPCKIAKVIVRAMQTS